MSRSVDLPEDTEELHVRLKRIPFGSINLQVGEVYPARRMVGGIFLVYKGVYYKLRRLDYLEVNGRQVTAELERQRVSMAVRKRPEIGRKLGLTRPKRQIDLGRAKAEVPKQANDESV
jgi:hypothetical protein